MSTQSSSQPHESSADSSTDDHHRCRSRRWKATTVIGTATSLFLAYVAWDESQTAREQKDINQALESPQLDFEYMVLPPPGSLKLDGDAESEIRVQEIVEEFSSDTIVQSGKSVSMDSPTVDDVRNRGIQCSLPCEQVQEPGGDVTHEFIYLVVTNSGKTTAGGIEVDFESTTPDNTNVTILEYLFLSMDGAQSFREKFLDIEPGQRLIIPLVSVVPIVDEAGNSSFIGVGESRKPITIYWEDIFDDNRRDKGIRPPSDSLAARPELGVLVGG
jgi:hypothetical protein